MIVTDASAILGVLLRLPHGKRIEDRLFEEDSLHAPHLLDLEVAQVLRRYCLSGEMAETRAEEALADLSDFPLERYPHEPFLPRIWQLRKNVTAYDAAYLVLAEELGASLVTTDRRLASVPGVRAKVEVF